MVYLNYFDSMFESCIKVIFPFESNASKHPRGMGKSTFLGVEHPHRALCSVSVSGTVT